jgi:hypothetical protein
MKTVFGLVAALVLISGTWSVNAKAEPPMQFSTSGYFGGGNFGASYSVSGPGAAIPCPPTYYVAPVWRTQTWGGYHTDSWGTPSMSVHQRSSWDMYHSTFPGGIDRGWRNSFEESIRYR